MWMNQSFAFRHRQADDPLTRSLFAVVPNHPDVAAVPNRHRDDSPLFQHRSRSLERGLGNKWTQPILTVNAQDGIGTPDIFGIDVDADKAILDASRQDRQALQTVRMMAAQIGFRQNVGLNRTFPRAGSKP
jgi:hypothetical protein